MAEVSGPEKFAPPERRPPEKRNDIERIPTLRQHRSDAAPTTGSAVDDLNAVVRRVAGDSIEEIDRVIRALENVRDMMRNEGERVSREIAGYASLSHAAATAMKVIADSIHQWKDTSGKPGPRSPS
jgi:phosphopantothenate synthetase